MCNPVPWLPVAPIVVPAPVGSNLAFACTGNYVVRPHLCVSQNNCGDESPEGPTRNRNRRHGRRERHGTPHHAWRKNLHASLDECNKVAGNGEPMPMQHRGNGYTERLVYILMCVSNCQKNEDTCQEFLARHKCCQVLANQRILRLRCRIVGLDNQVFWRFNVLFSLQICMTR